MNATAHRRKSVLQDELSTTVPIVTTLFTVAIGIFPVVLHTNETIRSHILDTFRPYAVMRLGGKVSQ